MSIQRLSVWLFAAVLTSICQNAVAVIEFVENSISVREADGVVTLSVRRTGAAADAAAITIATAKSTMAESGTDFFFRGARLIWQAGEVGIKTAKVSILTDFIVEGAETVDFSLSGIVGDELGGNNSLRLSILDSNLVVAEDNGLTKEQYDAAVVLDKVCNAANAAQIEGCNLLEVLSDDDQARALESILPRNVVQHVSNMVVAQSGSNQAIRARMQNVRAGDSNPLSGFNLMSPEGSQSMGGLLDDDWESYRGGSAGVDDVGERWGVFLSGQLQSAEQDSTSQILGYQSDANQVTGGLDYRIGSDVFVGSALSYSQADTDSDVDSGSQDATIAILSLFGSYYFAKQWYLDAVFSVGSVDFDMERNFRFGDTVAKTAADASGQQFGLSVGGGYEIAVSAWQLATYCRIDAIQATVDSYEESGGAGLGLSVEERESNSSQAILGGSVALVHSVAYGVLIPKLTAEWVREFYTDPGEIKAHFVVDPGAGSFILASPDMDAEFLNLGASLVATFSHGLSAYMRYEAVVERADYIGETFDVGGRWSF